MMPAPVSPAHACLSEDELLQLALGNVASQHALELLAEAERCPECSLVLAAAGEAVARDAGDPEESSPFWRLQRALRAGDVLGERFEVVRLLGAGGMGEVYEAIDRELGERLALKTIRGGLARTPERVERLKQEIRLARRVVHPNVCRVLEFGRHEDARGSCYFLTMELLGGESLSDRLQRAGALSTEEALSVLADLCGGLEAIHAEGILHRDIKTHNVMLCGKARAGHGPERAVLLDFGIARPSDASDAPWTTGSVAGTPEYMAPEQVRGQPLSPAADIYALGVVLFELLVGRLPFEGEGALERAVKRLQGKAPRASTCRPGLEPGVDELVAWCLELEPGHRPRDAAELRAAVRALQAGSFVRPTRPGIERSASTGAATPFTHRPAGTWRSARRLGSAVAVLSVLGAFMIWAWLSARPAPGPVLPQVTHTPSTAAQPRARALGEAVTPWPGTSAPQPEAPRLPEGAAPPQPKPVAARPTRSARRTTPPAVPAQAAPVQAAPGDSTCSPPYYYDERGLRIYRKDCL